jgi:hypothetical protein
VNVPAGPADLLVEVRSQRHPVVVAQGGAVLGTLPPGTTTARYSLKEVRGGRLDLTLTAETFVARGGRQLGFLLDRVLLETAPPGAWPPLPLFLTLAVPTLAALGLGRWVGLESGSAAALAAALLAVQALSLFRYGLVRSPYSRELSFWLVAGTVLSALIARGLSRRADLGAGASQCSFLALLLAFLVQGVAAAHPCLVASDAVFHAHNLRAVSFGDFWLTSLTPHDPPFQFPYGVSFYVALVPLLHTGLDLTTLVRFGASATVVFAAAAFFSWLAPAGAARAGIAVALLQVLPVTFDLWSAGNYSNVFAQAITLLFLAWWSGSAPGGFPVGALLLTVAATAHFGGLLFLLSLAAFLLVAEGRGLDRTRALALGTGLGAALAYYLQFLPMVLGQVPRALAGQPGPGGGLLLGILGQVRQAGAEWGLPILPLAALGLWSMGLGTASRGERCLRAMALAGVPFLLAAAGSALEVRYLYALTPAVAVLAADGLIVAGRRPFLRAAAVVVASTQAGLAFVGVARAVYERYRA